MSVSQIFKTAKEAGLCCLAITDHDTVSGVEEAQRCSKTYDIESIPSIEISADKDGVEVHVLGYFIDPKNQRLLDSIKNVREHRTNRLIHMADRLNVLGIKVDKEELFDKIGKAMPTRLHLGVYLVEKKIVLNLRQAFKKHLAPGRPAYISRFKYSVKETVDIIRNAGGLPFLAHPHILPNFT